MSIGLVLFAHALDTPHFFPRAIVRGLVEPGRLGVEVFFVISGFLITSLLLEEKDQTGAISLGSFYARRAIRIMPAFFAFLGVVAILKATGVISLPPNNLLYAFTYTLNSTRAEGSPFTGSLWSLAVEEQFYLIWPAAVAFLSRRNLVIVILAAVGVPPLLRALAATGTLPLLAELPNSFPLVADSLAWGCLAALVKPGLQGDIAGRLLRSRAVYLGPLLIIALCSVEFRPRISGPVLFQIVFSPLIRLLITFCVVRFTLVYDDLGGKILNSRGLRTIGVLSYSIYLWQQLFVNRAAHSILQAFPLNLFCVIVVATLSYKLVEAPCLTLRRYFVPPNRRPDRASLTAGLDVAKGPRQFATSLSDAATPPQGFLS